MFVYEGNDLNSLFKVKRGVRSMRQSSYARDGTNEDCIAIKPGETLRVFGEDKPGIMRHIWITMDSQDPQFLRKTVLRMYWDDEPEPSVECPIGDFFGVGFGVRRNFTSAPLMMNPEDGKGFNCYFPMPFEKARITVHNECGVDVVIYYYFDYELVPALPGDAGRFHAQWRRTNPTDGLPNEAWVHHALSGNQLRQYIHENVWFKYPNTTGDGNYVILEAQGAGQYVGCVLNIDCFERQINDWYGEGDDMIFIDGQPWPPDLHGTGTEDYFNTAYCPRTEYSGPYSGLTLYSGDTPDGWPFSGKNSMYRFHILDPIRFGKSIKVTIEHGSSNCLNNDYSSTAYWYQLEPHAKTAELPPAELRVARDNALTDPGPAQLVEKIGFDATERDFHKNWIERNK